MLLLLCYPDLCFLVQCFRYPALCFPCCAPFLSLIHRHTACWNPMPFPLLFLQVLVFSSLHTCSCVVAFLSCFFFTTEVSAPTRSTVSSSGVHPPLSQWCILNFSPYFHIICKFPCIFAVICKFPLFLVNVPVFCLIYVFCSPILTMMHLCIMLCTCWTPLLSSYSRLQTVLVSTDLWP